MAQPEEVHRLAAAVFSKWEREERSLLAAWISLEARVAVMTQAGAFAAEGPVEKDRVAFPIQVGPGGRHFVDREGRPFFYHADTAWTIVKKLTPAEVDEYLDSRKALGFNTIHVHAVSKEQGPPANRDGEEPFAPLDDITKPNERYWRGVDRVLEAAAARDILVVMSAAWIRWGGDDREGWRSQLTKENARAYGRFLAGRYGRFQNLMWILGGDADPGDRLDATRELAAALREAVPAQLLTYHAAPEHSSSAWFHGDAWLGFDMAYTYRPPGAHVLEEYRRPPPVRPIVLGESAYEGEHDAGPHRIRRQAWCAVLSGALGGQAHGHKSIWRFDAGWRAALEAKGARHLAHLKRLITSLQWHRLVPDDSHTFLTAGSGAPDREDHAAAARADDGSFALVYLPASRAVTVDLSRLASSADSAGLDPTDGRRIPIEGSPFLNSGKRELTPPAKNAAGDSDFVLLLEVSRQKP